MIQPGVTLLQHSPLFPGESLRSLLARLAWENRLSSLQAHRLYFPDLPASAGIDRVAPMDHQRYRHLALVTGLDASELLDATPHRFAEVEWDQQGFCDRQPIPTDLSPQRVPEIWRKSFSDTQHVWFCPICLQATSYHRLYWDMAWCGMCLTHHCLLRNRCGECNTLSRVDALIRGTCQRCQQAYSSSSGTNLALANWEGITQQLMAHWMRTGSDPGVEWRTHWNMPSWPIATLLAFLHTLIASGVKPLSDPSVALSEQDSHKLVRHWGTAMKALVNWPHHFHVWLEK
jgi:TniQ